EFLLGALAKDHVELDLAGLPVAIVPGARIERLAAHARLEPKAAQHLHGVAADLDAGAQPRELLRLLVNGDVDADLSQSRAARKPAQAGTDNPNRKRFCHRLPTMPPAREPAPYYAGRNPAFVKAARPSSDASASRKACTAGLCSRAFTSAKS